MAEQKSSPALTAPVRGAASVLRRVPGADTVSRAAADTLDKVSAVSPRRRRIAVYVGAGVLGAAGVVEWPVALTGAAVAWLTQPRPAHPAGAGQATGTPAEGPELAAADNRRATEPPGPVAVGDRAAEEKRPTHRTADTEPEPPHDLGTAALRSGGGAEGAEASGGAGVAAEAEAGGGRDAEASRGSRVSGGAQAAGGSGVSGSAKASGGMGMSGSGQASGTTEASGTASGGARAAGGGGPSDSTRASGGAGVSRTAEASRERRASGGAQPTGDSGAAEASHGSRAAHHTGAARSHGATGPLGPTARPGRTTR
ncbi:hypothetical protein ACH47Z_29720 [Streptomyces sp. NPDC020192]|uniref:hypothetical protein n=1 Tax=Streptomyces sp. NPDC020192 TaxID=3365066 RepID=UPI0037B167C3